MSPTDQTAEQAPSVEADIRPTLPIGPDLGPLRLLTYGLLVAVVAFGVFVLVSAVQRPLDGTPRTAAERTLLDAQRAIEEDPRDVDARLRLARVYVGMGQLDSAMRTLDAAEQLEPENLAVVHMLGLTYLESGDPLTAIDYLERAAEMGGGFAEDYVGVWSDIARARSLQNDDVGAAAAYEKALVYAPQAADVIFDLAQTYERLGRTGEAVRAYEGVLQYLPEHPGAIEALDRLGSDS